MVIFHSYVSLPEGNGHGTIDMKPWFSLHIQPCPRMSSWNIIIIVNPTILAFAWEQNTSAHPQIESFHTGCRHSCWHRLIERERESCSAGFLANKKLKLFFVGFARHFSYIDHRYIPELASLMLLWSILDTIYVWTTNNWLVYIPLSYHMAEKLLVPP